MRSSLLVGVIAVAACKWQPHAQGAGSGSSSIASAGSAAADANGWIVDTLPGDHVEVLALAGSSATDVYAAGEDLLAHFDGKAWSDETPAAVRCRTCQLNSISVAAPNDVWAVGNDGMVAHYDGKTWTVTQPQILRVERGVRVYADLSHVVAWPGKGMVASIEASNELVRFDGTSWTKLPAADAWVDVFWGTAPDDLWVWDRSSSSRFDMSMKHFNGTRWEPEMKITSGPEIVQLDGSGPKDIWAVGGEGGRSPVARAYHYDGNAWTEVKIADYVAVGGIGSIDVVGANQAYAAGKHGLLAWDGATWSTIPGPSALTNYDKLYAPGGGKLFVAAWRDGRVAHK